MMCVVYLVEQNSVTVYIYTICVKQQWKQNFTAKHPHGTNVEILPKHKNFYNI